MNQRRSQRVGIAGIAAVVTATAVVAIPGTPVAAVEVLTDDFRVSSMGPDGVGGFEAQQSKIAFDAVNDRYLVVWRGDDQGDGQAEIYGQLVNARTGAAFGSDDFLIARVGAAGEASTDAVEPAVAWSAATGEFVVVFSGDAAVDTPPIITDTFEIYAQRVSAAGVPQGTPLRISDMGSDDANGSYDANFPDIAYNADDDEFLVVWQGDDDTAPLVNNETEIHGQRLGYSGTDLAEIGSNDFRISTVGVDGATTTDGRAPAVAYNPNPSAREYYVTWEGNYNAASPGVFEVHGTRVNVLGVVENSNGIVLNTIAASDEELQPDVAANPVNGDFMVVWTGDNGADDFEIYRQRVSLTGTLVGTSAAISAAGPAGTAFVAGTPAIAFDSLQQQYVVVWTGDDSTLGTVDDEYEAFVRRIGSTGTPSGSAARISTMGFDNTINSSTSLPDVTFSDATIGAVGAVWNAENPPVTGAGEGEIWGQFDAPAGDLAVSISVESDLSPAPGDAVSYRISYSNPGSATVPDVQLSSIVDALVENPTSASSTLVGDTLTWSIGTLSPGASGSVVVDGTVLASAANGAVVDLDAGIGTGSLIVDTVAGNNSDADSVIVDRPPTVTIDQAVGQADPTNATSVHFTATFNEAVTGFAASDVSFAGSTVGGVLAATVTETTPGRVFDVAVSGQNGVGTIVTAVPAGGANDVDGSPDPNQASTSTDNTVAFDNVVPTVTIDQGAQVDPTNASPIVFTAVFSEPVAGFTGGDVAFTGSTVGGSLVAVVSGAGPTYTVSVTGMSGSGTVVASIPAGSANDPAGNANAASTTTDNSVTFDNVPPTVTIDQASGQADPTATAPVEFDVLFSEPVVGFDAADLSFAGSTAPGALLAAVTGSGASYTVSVDGMTGSGLVVASIPAGRAADLTGNLSAASSSTDNSIMFDTAAPTVTIDQALVQVDPINAAPILFTVVFSEPVVGFTGADVDLSGSSLSGLAAGVSGSGANYTVSVTGMNGVGTVVASIPADAANDGIGNGNAASTSADNSVTFDNVQPTVAIDQAGSQTDPTSAASITFAVVFSEPVDGFSASDVDLSASSLAGLSAAVSGAGASYTVSVSGMIGDGTVVASIPASGADDLAGNLNAASTSTDNTVTFVDPPPTVTINQGVGQVDPINTAPVVFAVEFSEPVVGFTAADVDLSASSLSGLAAAVSGSGASYTVSVTGMTGVGTVVASIPAASVVDLGGNGNAASTSTDNMVTFDNVQPTVTVNSGFGQPDPTSASPIVFDVVFSEPVSGFGSSDVVFFGSSMLAPLTAVVSGSGAFYTVSVTGMVGNGTVVASVLPFAANDVAGNFNTLFSTSTDNTVMYNDPPPTVTIDQAAAQPEPAFTSPIVFDVVFSEPVSGLPPFGVSFAGSTVGGPLVANVSGSGANYTVSVSGMVGTGLVVASIVPGATTDAFGNANLGSTSTDNSVFYVDLPPTVTINQAALQVDPTNAGLVDFDVVFSEPVIGFSGAAVSLAGSSVGGSLFAVVSGSGANYTVSVGGMSGVGTVVASILPNQVFDAAFNFNAPSTSLDNTVTFDGVPPTVTIDQAALQADPTNGSPVVFTAVFSEPVTGFDGADISFAGSTGGGSLMAVVSGSGPSYTVSVTGMPAGGTVVAAVPPSSAQDLAGNPNAPSTSLDNTVTFDSVAPSVTIDQAVGQVDPTDGSPIIFTVVFTEPVTGFSGTDVSFAGSSVGGTPAATVSGSGTTYTVSVTGMSGAGTVVASVPSGVAQDAAGNGNGTSTSIDGSVVYDSVKPTVTVDQAAGQGDPTNVSPIVFTAVFSEPVTGLTAADVVLGGTANPTTVTVTGAGTTWTLTVAGMTGFGTVTAALVAGAAEDAPGNTSVASTSTDNSVTHVPGDPNLGVNDPPVVTAPASATGELGVAVTFTGANAISVVDPDALGLDILVTLTATDATITVPATAGAVLIGNGTGELTITGPMTSVNAALAGLSVVFSEVGARSIDIDASDLGHAPPPALGDSATISVTIVDTAPPIITVPSATVVAATDPGQPGATVVYVVTVSDAGSSPPSPGLVEAAPPTLSCTPPSGSFFPIGTTTVNCTATDSVGNSSTASFAVQVVDGERPTITPPANMRITLPSGTNSGVVTYAVPTVADNSGQATVSCVPASGSTFPAGITVVTCTVSDPAGNTASATFQIEVVSGVLPATGGGAGLVPAALASVVLGFGLMLTGRRRRTVRA